MNPPIDAAEQVARKLLEFYTEPMTWKVGIQPEEMTALAKSYLTLLERNLELESALQRIKAKYLHVTNDHTTIYDIADKALSTTSQGNAGEKEVK